MGSASEDLLVTLQILPGFFSNCLFLAVYDSVVLVKRVVTLLSRSRSAGCGEWRRMLTSEGLRSIWNSFLLDAHKQVKLGCEAPNSKVVKVPDEPWWSSTVVPCGSRIQTGGECHLLDFESSDRPLVVNFGSAT
ncbi:Type II iodothyronine deiodinase [Ameca splendens]|uniref:Iodothyronine deiodinase n=5 Tax=Goodeidae TaxID=28758 RepID=A0ABV0ZAX8_9TELE